MARGERYLQDPMRPALTQSKNKNKCYSGVALRSSGVAALGRVPRGHLSQTGGLQLSRLMASLNKQTST